MAAVDPGGPVFDGDNHYYEAEDAFTRHLDPAHEARCVQWANIDGRRRHVVGGRVNRGVTNPTFDPVSKPGCLYAIVRGRAGDVDPYEVMRNSKEPIRAEYRDRDARIAVLDQQGLAGCWLFPTLAVLYEEALRDDPHAAGLTFSAFNRWLRDDWGFAYHERLFGAPYLALADVGWAVAELAWALDNDARIIVMRPGAPWTPEGRVSPFDLRFDPFWQLVNDAGITVVVHAGDSGVTTDGYAVDGFGMSFSEPSLKNFALERAISDYLLSMVAAKHFDRFPNLRIASVENGAQFLPDGFRKLRALANRSPAWFRDDPVDTFRNHVWINPFWEDDLATVVEHMGAERVVFGSDWPHIEGLPHPLDYLDDAAVLDDASRRSVLHDNAVTLTQRRLSG